MMREPHIVFPLPHRLINVTEYHRMAETGIIQPSERVELLFGKILSMSPVGVRHALCVKLVNSFFSPLLPKDLAISVQDPIQLDPHSEPEPDIAIIQGPLRKYMNRLPGASDTLLVIEVAGSSYDRDMKLKVPMYAQAGIPHCWIIDLNQDQIHVFSHPVGEAYEKHQIHEIGEEVEVTPLGVSLPVKDLL